MALSSALNAALSGLSVSARRAEVVSANIANAATPGYGRRELLVQSDALAPGLRMLGLDRRADPGLLTERRSASAQADGAAYLSEQWLRLERAFGQPGEAGSLTEALDRFDAALIRAAGAPETEANLASLGDAAQRLAGRFSDLSEGIRLVRSDADARIGAMVFSLNENLSRIAVLDRQIVSARASGRDIAAIQDQRQQLVDQVAGIVPLREVPRADGRPALIAANGAVLLDGNPAVIGFSPTPIIPVGSTAPLSGLTLNGQSVSSSETGLLGGGMLTAAFTLRDDITPALLAEVDTLALDLATRIAGADPTLGAGMPGLFTDAGLIPDSTASAGLAARLAVNPLVDPEAGGDLWRLRDGLGAAAPGPQGDGSLLLALRQAVEDPTPRSFAGMAADALDRLSMARVRAEGDAARQSARAAVLTEAEAQRSVNTDEELQNLLQIEKAYAANARVMQVVDRLLQTLLEV